VQIAAETPTKYLLKDLKNALSENLSEVSLAVSRHHAQALSPSEDASHSLLQSHSASS
jgi:hypothetical protein